MSFRGAAVCSLGVAVALVVGGDRPASAAPIVFQEDLGNFPDAIAVTMQFDTFVGLNINGDTINDTGFLIQVDNTSFGDGAFSSFATDPDGNFAVNEVLTAAAETALTNNQPFGLFAFGAGMPVGSGAFVSAPSGFTVGGPGLGDLPEINFVIALNNTPLVADGLFFDPNAPTIPNPPFTNSRTGTAEFFISTPAGFDPSQLPIGNEGLPVLDIATRMAWQSGADPNDAAFVMGFNGEELRPRGEMLIPEPSTALLLASGLAALALRRRRTVA